MTGRAAARLVVQPDDGEAASSVKTTGETDFEVGGPNGVRVPRLER